MNQLPSDEHRIAFLAAEVDLGGGATFHLNLAGELIKRGISTHIFSLSESNPLAADFSQRGIPVTTSRMNGTISEDRIIKLLRQIEKFKPTVIIAVISYGPCELLRYLPKDLTRIGVLHNENPNTLSMAKTYIDEMHYVVSVSKKLRELLELGLGKDLQKNLAVELGVPIPNKPLDTNLIKGNPLRILYLGRLEEIAKRVRLFPRIFDRLKKAGIPFMWSIAGDGSERQFLEKTMVSNNPEQIIKFCGTVSYNKVPALIESHDVILLTSDSEAFPLGLQEAMAAGLVPVASAIHGRVSEIVTPLTGVPVKLTEPDGYAEGIIWLHNNRNEMLKMSARSRDMILPYSIEAMTDRWLELVNKAPKRLIYWPEHFKFQIPLNRNKFYFSLPMRILRRMLAKLKPNTN